jgi:type I restriction enzyme M protein
MSASTSRIEEVVQAVLPDSVRRRVDDMWNSLWSSGVTNPLSVVDYLSTVLLVCFGNGDKKDVLFEVRSAAAGGDVVGVERLLSALQRRYGLSSPDPSIWEDLNRLSEVLDRAVVLEVEDRNRDILGDTFEYILSHLSTAGHFGQFRTPRHLIQFIVEALAPSKGEVVLDPACGTGGFLIAAHEFRGGLDEVYLGDEIDWTMTRIARANLALHGLVSGQVRQRDGLTELAGEADVILANPPFAGTVNAQRLAGFESGANKTELLFVEMMMRRLHSGGRAGVVVPSGVLASSAAPAVFVRRRLVEQNSLDAVVELPAGVFRPYTDSRTAVLFWTNEKRAAASTTFLRIFDDGFTLDDRREQTGRSDLPMALDALRAVTPTGRDSTRVGWADRETLARDGFNLSPARYLTSPLATRQRPAQNPAEALRQVLTTNDRLVAALTRLKELVR